MLISELFNVPITPQPTIIKQPKHRKYISKNEIKTIAVVLTSLTLLKKEKEFEEDLTDSKNSHNFIDIKDEKIIKHFNDYKEKEQEFFTLAQKILKHYEQIDISILDKAREQTAKYIEGLFIKLAKKNFTIKGIALLQELARHRIASLSVKSTRYTLKELKQEDTFLSREKRSNEEIGDFFILAPDLKRASKYIVLTDNDEVNKYSVMALENLRQLLVAGIANDKAKYALPECYKTELTWTINARSLQNFFNLRSDKSALWEIRDLANEVYKTLPEDHKYLFKSAIKKRE